MPQTETLHIPAVHCDACINSIQKIVERQGATFESGDPDTKTVTITYDEVTVARAQIVEALTDAEFEPAAT